MLLLHHDMEDQATKVKIFIHISLEYRLNYYEKSCQVEDVKRGLLGIDILRALLFDTR